VRINPNDSLCWHCANAIPSAEKKTGCSWSIWREDVPGWEIIETVRRVKYNHQEIEKTGKTVIKCPMFKEG
jgi:hypothetical protein